MNAPASEAKQLQAPIFRRLHCHAISTDPRSVRIDPQARCGNLVGYADRDVRFVDVAARAPAQPDGRDWVRCSRCKTWNIFEAVAGE